MAYVCSLTLEELNMDLHPSFTNTLKNLSECEKQARVDAHAQKVMGNIPHLTYNQQVLNKLIAQHGMEKVAGWLEHLSNEGSVPTPVVFNTDTLMGEANVFFSNCINLLRKKNTDYNKATDALSGFRKFGVHGILVRLEDKLGRVANLLNKEAQVKDESVDDTLLDIANYAFLAYACRKAGILQ